ncbi:MAG: bifunctional oligoribonuclease/PAP phosphatase NrnA [Lachnospiraceae bacterium]|nr:bifunctional oligoribonuclease/PAP phosphatase NrnA [Lachnospiraceae bacterium]
MNTEIKQQIFDSILQFDTIIISRHKRPDGDASGSTLGLQKLLQASFPEKRIFLDNEDYAEFTTFLGDEGPHPSDEDYEDALVIVIDTGTIDRVSNSRAERGKKLIKIDHHIDKRPFGDISWVEEDRSSACEMIVDFFQSFEDRLVLNKEAATCLYAGMVTDSGRFKYQGTDARTLRAAAVLLERNIDMERLYANLNMEDYEVHLFDADLTRKIKRTPNGVAWLYISKTLRKSRGMSQETASNTVNLMDKIKGSLIWLAFIENEDASIRVRLRSRFIEVESLAGRFGGGGHANASGATVYSRKEVQMLLQEADEMISAYKADHPDVF